MCALGSGGCGVCAGGVGLQLLELWRIQLGGATVPTIPTNQLNFNDSVMVRPTAGAVPPAHGRWPDHAADTLTFQGSPLQTY